MPKEPRPRFARVRRALTLATLLALSATALITPASAQTCAAGQFIDDGACADCAAGTSGDGTATSCADCGVGNYATGANAVCQWDVATDCAGNAIDEANWVTALQEAYQASHGLDGSKIAATCAYAEGGLSFFKEQAATCVIPLPDSGTMTLTCAPSVSPTGTIGMVCETAGQADGFVSGCGEVTNNGAGLDNEGTTVTCVFEGKQSSCSQCPAGTECELLKTSIAVPCPAGEYNGAAGGSCAPCPAGYKCASAATITPQSCLAGTSSAQGSLECSTCDAGTFAASAASATCTSCTAGYKCESPGTVTPEICAAGSAAAEGSSTCSPCLAGTYAATVGSTSCLPCPAGYKCESTAERITPSACPAGSYAEEGSTSCELCDIGTYQPSSASGSCLACPVGKSCPTEGLTAYQECGAGTYSGWALKDVAVAFARPYNDTDPLRQPTAAASGGGCVTCPEGYSCADGASAPALCPIGTQSYAGAQACSNCTAGSACPTPLPGDQTQCQAGTFSLGRAAACTECDPGRYCTDTTQDIQLNCALGFYSYGGAVSACTRCEVGKQCPATDGSGNADCAPGTFSEGGQTHCSFCPPGRYCNDTSSATAQYDCAKGTYSLGSVSACSSCPAGTFGLTTAAVSDEDCTKCPAGMYSTATAASDSSTCVLCPVDTSCPNAGTVTPTPCASGSGTFGDVGQTSCGLAPPPPNPPPSPPPSPPPPSPPSLPPLNVTINVPEISLRLQGNVEGWTETDATAFKTGIASALSDGTTANDVEILGIKQGSVIVVFTINSLAMLPTSYGGDWNQTYLSQAVTKISDAVTASTLNVGAVPLSLPSVDCAAGSYVSSSASAAVRECSLCNPGSYSTTTNAAQCLTCGAGTATGFRGSTGCPTCVPGTVAPLTGALECALCPRGTIQPASGMTSCVQCQDNFFAGSFGSVACVACPSGFVSGAPAWVGETPRMRADGVLSVEVQEAIDGVRCIPDGTYELPPLPPPPLGVREADKTSWTVGGIALSVYGIILWIISRRIWAREKLTLQYAENESFVDAITPLMENTAASRGTIKEFEDEDLRYAIDCFRRGGIEEAEEIYARMAERNPGNADIMHGLAICRAFAGDTEYAHAFAQRSASLTLTAQRQITLGNIFLAQGKLAKASTVYAMAIRRDPVSAVAHFNIGNAHFLAGDAASARVSYLAALDREPNYFKALYNLAIVIDSIGSVGEAKEWMKRAVDCRLNDSRATYALALLYVKLGQWKKAEYHFEQTLNLDAKHAPSQVKLGNLAFRRGDFQRSGANYLNALEVDPGNVEALTNLAMLDWCKGLLSACNEQLRLALTINPSYYPALYNLTLTRLSQGRIEDCMKYYQRTRACADSSALSKTQMFNLSMALAELDELDDADVPEEFTPNTVEHQLMKIALAKIQPAATTDDGKSSKPATTKQTLNPIVATADVEPQPPKMKRSNTTRVYESLVFISDAMKFPERLEACALDDTCVILYEHDVNSAMLCRKLIAKAKERLSTASGLQPVERVAVIAPTFPGGVRLGDDVIMDKRTVMQTGDIALFLKGLNEILGLQQWRGKRLDFLTLDYSLEENVSLLRMIKYEHQFECEVSCSDKMESSETYDLTAEQLKAMQGAAGGAWACLRYFVAGSLKDWAALPQAPPRHKVIEASGGGLLALRESEEEKVKVSWRTAAKMAMSIAPKAQTIVPMAKANIEPPPAVLAPAEVDVFGIRRTKKHQPTSRTKSHITHVDIEVMTHMPVAKFKSHATQLFFCKEIAVELGVDVNRVRVARTDDIADTVTVRITERRDGSDEGGPLEILVKKLQNAIKDGYFIIDEAFGEVDVMGVFWPPADIPEDDDGEEAVSVVSEVSSGGETRASHDENATPHLSEFTDFDVSDTVGRKTAFTVASASLEPTLSARSLEPTSVRQTPLTSTIPAQDFVEIEYNDADGSRESRARWDFDRNIANLRNERTGIWDTGDLR